ncbi:MAG: hypothetical protein JO311_08110 [Candidatus Eremiobacteraeota bacterium]|nr:hypothetical protein [Candidatus Eremiobacteraeota bacterium]
MRSTTIGAAVASVACAIALAACSGNGTLPSSTMSAPQSQNAGAAPDTVAAPDTAAAPDTSGAPNGDASGSGNDLTTVSNDSIDGKVVTCATSPPQYEWIFEGTCTHFYLTKLGAKFALGKHDDITVSGSIGENNLKAKAIVYVADATNNKDILTYKGKKFPAYVARGKTFIYATAINQSKYVIIPKASKIPVLQYVISDGKGIPGKSCAAAVLTFSHGKPQWKPLPVHAKVQGKTVTITQYNATPNFQLPPQTPLYFGVNCF